MRIRSWPCHPDFPAAEESSYRGCWEYELQPGESTVSHQHDGGDEITIALEGCGRITVGEISRELRPGEVVFIPSRTNHSILNDSGRPIRGLTIETSVKLFERDTEDDETVSVRDMESVIEEIPNDLDESEALQFIIRLFDLAGRLSEQIEFAVGLESSTGLEALKNLEKRVMSAVVLISQNYENGPSFRHPRF